MSLFLEIGQKYMLILSKEMYFVQQKHDKLSPVPLQAPNETTFYTFFNFVKYVHTNLGYFFKK